MNSFDVLAQNAESIEFSLCHVAHRRMTSEGLARDFTGLSGIVRRGNADRQAALLAYRAQPLRSRLAMRRTALCACTTVEPTADGAAEAAAQAAGGEEALQGPPQGQPVIDPFYDPHVRSAIASCASFHAKAAAALELGLWGDLKPGTKLAPLWNEYAHACERLASAAAEGMPMRLAGELLEVAMAQCGGPHRPFTSLIESSDPRTQHAWVMICVLRGLAVWSECTFHIPKSRKDQALLHQGCVTEALALTSALLHMFNIPPLLYEDLNDAAEMLAALGDAVLASNDAVAGEPYTCLLSPAAVLRLMSLARELAADLIGPLPPTIATSSGPNPVRGGKGAAAAGGSAKGSGAAGGGGKGAAKAGGKAALGAAGAGPAGPVVPTVTSKAGQGEGGTTAAAAGDGLEAGASAQPVQTVATPARSSSPGSGPSAASPAEPHSSPGPGPGPGPSCTTGSFRAPDPAPPGAAEAASRAPRAAFRLAASAVAKVHVGVTAALVKDRAEKGKVIRELANKGVMLEAELLRRSYEHFALEARKQCEGQLADVKRAQEAAQRRQKAGAKAGGGGGGGGGGAGGDESLAAKLTCHQLYVKVCVSIASRVPFNTYDADGGSGGWILLQRYTHRIRPEELPSTDLLLESEDLWRLQLHECSRTDPRTQRRELARLLLALAVNGDGEGNPFKLTAERPAGCQLALAATAAANHLLGCRRQALACEGPQPAEPQPWKAAVAWPRGLLDRLEPVEVVVVTPKLSPNLRPAFCGLKLDDLSPERGDGLMDLDNQVQLELMPAGAALQLRAEQAANSIKTRKFVVPQFGNLFSLAGAVAEALLGAGALVLVCGSRQALWRAVQALALVNQTSRRTEHDVLALPVLPPGRLQTSSVLRRATEASIGDCFVRGSTVAAAAAEGGPGPRSATGGGSAAVGGGSSRGGGGGSGGQDEPVLLPVPGMPAMHRAGFTKALERLLGLAPDQEGLLKRRHALLPDNAPGEGAGPGPGQAPSRAANDEGGSAAAAAAAARRACSEAGALCLAPDTEVWLVVLAVGREWPCNHPPGGQLNAGRFVDLGRMMEAAGYG
ncbi:hypothetical protein HYH03_007011 [Edaphochlamys debaryana]|uniref:Uncharacterized protein n=1 Tax=Edaphochlamys debaryana TaxID=47281 RepID=A0A835Y5W8_9CHLO|nr:hypothetical protein HYH03_007011 [Edaphochlamys debaryana]|eukprot:KAG2494766.1 hypothetical protein HYH03_007011 [Edaphochlamys debaryana]